MLADPLPHEKIIVACREALSALDTLCREEIWPMPQELVRARVCLEIAIANQQTAVRNAFYQRLALAAPADRSPDHDH